MFPLKPFLLNYHQFSQGGPVPPWPPWQKLLCFKVFINQLRAYLEQDQNNYLFLPEGCYAAWQPRQEGRRILGLAAEDVDNQKLIKQADNDHGGTFDLEEEQNRLLLLRNSQLSKFITLIAIACYYTCLLYTSPSPRDS